MTRSAYPRNLDVFLPLIDGLHPIASDDLNLLHDALEQVEQALGYGASDVGGVYGPKGGNVDVRERIDAFLDDDGGLRDVAFVTGTATYGQMSELNPAGFYVPFGKSLSSDDYTVIWSAMSSSPSHVVEQGGNPPRTEWDAAVPAIAWIANQGRTANGVFLYARTAIIPSNFDHRIDPNDQRTFKYALLAFGPGATY